MNASSSSVPRYVPRLTVAGRPAAPCPAARCSPRFLPLADCRLRAGVPRAEAPTGPDGVRAPPHSFPSPTGWTSVPAIQL